MISGRAGPWAQEFAASTGTSTSIARTQRSEHVRDGWFHDRHACNACWSAGNGLLHEKGHIGVAIRARPLSSPHKIEPSDPCASAIGRAQRPRVICSRFFFLPTVVQLTLSEWTHPSSWSRPLRVLSLALLALACAPLSDHTSLGAQSLAARVAAVGDGDARIMFAARPDICGDGRSFIMERLGGSGEARIYSGDMNFTTTDTKLNSRCDEGPVSVLLGVRNREVTWVRVRVGPVMSLSGESNLGTVSAADAASYLLTLAGKTSDAASHDALLAATLADSTKLSAPLSAIARNRSLRASLREQVLRHLPYVAQREGDRGARAVVRSIALDEDDVLSVRERAVRVYGQDAGTAELRDLFSKLQETTLRERAVRSAAEIGDKAAVDWMYAVVMDASQPSSIRERAVRVLAELGRADLLLLAYPKVSETALRDRIIRVQAEAGGAEARKFLRAIAEDRTASRAERDRAIRTIGEQGDAAYLRGLYTTLDDRGLRERVLRIVVESSDARAWLRAIAANDKKEVELRDRAVRLLAEQGAPSSELATLYDRLAERALRSRIISLLAERGDDAAFSKLEAIARGDTDPDLRRRAARSMQKS